MKSEYVENKGQHCPLCGSHDIAGDEWEVDAGTAWQQVRCNRCEAEWVDHYNLVDYEITHDPAEEKKCEK